ncbi:hypothetical protein [Nitratidesulfovibrio vulgaris]|uniref:hypothetical protein n=1 Tax=Nitratidesulfovibrio vulgaris TaxID=881 RepID=UPI001232852F|nr:hypothetical protein [Nitratidesulfovibrio vulgaris]
MLTIVSKLATALLFILFISAASFEVGYFSSLNLETFSIVSIDDITLSPAHWWGNVISTLIGAAFGVCVVNSCKLTAHNTLNLNKQTFFIKRVHKFCLIIIGLIIISPTVAYLSFGIHFKIFTTLSMCMTWYLIFIFILKRRILDSISIDVFKLCLVIPTIMLFMYNHGVREAKYGNIDRQNTISILDADNNVMIAKRILKNWTIVHDSGNYAIIPTSSIKKIMSKQNTHILDPVDSKATMHKVPAGQDQSNLDIMQRR